MFHPLASADESIDIKLIYDGQFIISEQADDDYLIYSNHGTDSSVLIDFDNGHKLIIRDRGFNAVKAAQYSFVAEKLASGSLENDCLQNSDASLRSVILYCSGYVRVRKLTWAEMMQIKEFKNNREGKLNFDFMKKNKLYSTN